MASTAYADAAAASAMAREIVPMCAQVTVSRSGLIPGTGNTVSLNLSNGRLVF
ncbi:MAG: hypothetical protein M3Y42_12635 [Actinomycetota bacterium]|nr:hypothetical protein [Actinomycetota bacterium]MDQ2957800.1 hypothetical protein [Actinomycetota bacterium]